MTITEIRAYPTVVTSPTKCHESCLRSSMIVAKLRDLIVKGTPSAVLLELLDEMADAPQVEWNVTQPHPANGIPESP